MRRMRTQRQAECASACWQEEPLRACGARSRRRRNFVYECSRFGARIALSSVRVARACAGRRARVQSRPWRGRARVGGRRAMERSSFSIAVVERSRAGARAACGFKRLGPPRTPNQKQLRNAPQTPPKTPPETHPTTPPRTRPKHPPKAPQNTPNTPKAPEHPPRRPKTAQNRPALRQIHIAT